MEDMVFEDMEIASSSVVKQAARDFAAALAETPQFKTFEQADYAFRQDPVDQQAMQAYHTIINANTARLLLKYACRSRRRKLD